MLVPKVELSDDFLITLTAIFGTTISPYLFFWQAARKQRTCGPSPNALHC
jgi:Mn2+/Fe2+ NRAMP family transporter